MQNWSITEDASSLATACWPRESTAMKLVQKLTLALVLGTCMILAANGYLRVRREVAALQADRVSDHALIGHSLAAAAEAVWRYDGRGRALAIIEATNARWKDIHIRWLDAAPAGADVAALDATPTGEAVTRIGRDDTGSERRLTYVPVEVDGPRRGYIELSESLLVEERHRREIVSNTVATTLALMLVSAALSIVLGFWLVGRPVRALAEKARRVGHGDFSGPVVLRQKDELGELALEMNAMCDELVAAKDRVARETAARIVTLQQLRHADRLTTVGKLASGVAHELGTPLNVVSARASMIASGEATPTEATEYARIIVDATKRMTAIIRQLLAFARRGTSGARATKDPIVLVRESLDMLGAIAKKGRTTFEMRGTGDATVNVDAGQLQQVITNVVVNAIHASPDGGLVEVHVGHERATPPLDHGGLESEFVCIAVRDRGHGIAPDALPHIFEPFFTTKDVGEGTGLGLSVSLGIVQEHGGWIAVDSAPGKGSTFRIYLPSGAAT